MIALMDLLSIPSSGLNAKTLAAEARYLSISSTCACGACAAPGQERRCKLRKQSSQAGPPQPSTPEIDVDSSATLGSLDLVRSQEVLLRPPTVIHKYINTYVCIYILLYCA